MKITTCVFRLGLVGLGLACAPAALLHADPQDPPESKQPAETDQTPAAPGDAQRGPSADYWIGVQCSPIHDPALRAQLNLDRDQGGLLIEDVLPDSPAAKAGLKRFDVLLTVGDTRLRDMHSLQRAINRTAGGELKIELYRGGKQQAVTVKPAQRSEEFGPPSAFQPPPDALQQWL
ncbi:MAG TPA: PDZ domain-containing protein, partial [Pirellulales bacterium]